MLLRCIMKSCRFGRTTSAILTRFTFAACFRTSTTSTLSRAAGRDPVRLALIRCEHYLCAAGARVYCFTLSLCALQMMADIDAEETKMTEKSARHLTARDGDAFWFHNPQIVRLAMRARVCVTDGAPNCVCCGVSLPARNLPI
jgi:hypothetical protein